LYRFLYLSSINFYRYKSLRKMLGRRTLIIATQSQQAVQVITFLSTNLSNFVERLDRLPG